MADRKLIWPYLAVATALVGVHLGGCIVPRLDNQRCDADHACTDAHRCVEARCVPVEALTPCDIDDDCDGATRCDRSYCVPGVARDGGSDIFVDGGGTVIDGGSGAVDGGHAGGDGGPAPSDDAGGPARPDGGGDEEVDGGGAPRTDGGMTDGDDGGAGVDAGALDGGAVDAGVVDAGMADAGPGGDPWWDEAWPQRAWISLTSLQSTEALDDFTVFVAVPAQLVGLSIFEGRDLRFVTRDGDVLEFEVEQASQDALAIWVQVPTIPALSDAPPSNASEPGFYLYYANPMAPLSTASGAWDPTFEAVLHLDTTSSVGAMVLPDSSVWDRTALSPIGTIAVPGRFGGAMNFTTSIANGVDVPDLEGDGFPIAEGTIELWAYTDQPAQNLGLDNRLLDTWDDTRSHMYLRPSDGKMRLAIQAAGNSSPLVQMSTNFQSGRWNHFAITWQTADRRVLHYVNGQLIGSAVLPQGWSPDGQLTAFGRGWPGVVDEIRISSVVRSQAWITATYENGMTPLAP